MNKKDAIQIAADLNNRGLPYRFEADENCESPEPMCERCNTSDDCWAVKVESAENPLVVELLKIHSRQDNLTLTKAVTGGLFE